MKIAILTFSSKKIPSPPDQIFAPGVLANDIAEGLIKRGHQVDLFAPSDSVTKANLISFDLVSAFSRFQKEMAEKPLLYNYLIEQHELFLYSQALEIIRKSGDYDLIHAHDFRRLMYFSNFIDRPIYYTYHGNPDDDLANEIDQRRMKRYLNNNFFIAPTHKQIELGRGLFNFVGVVPHGVNLDLYKFSEESQERLLFAGRMMVRKGPDVAIRVAKKLEIPLTLIGDPCQSEEDKIYFEQKVKPNFGPGIEFAGHVPFDQLGRHYGAAKALLVPIFWDEPFGMVMIEAMACGTPIVAFGRGSVPEIVEDGKTGFIVDPESGEDGFRDAVEKILRMDPEKYKEMRRNCRKAVEMKFSVDTMVDGYEKIFMQSKV